MDSTDEQLSAISEKTLKEATYHLRWSSDWIIRLGDGTAESHKRIQLAFNELWAYSGEFLTNTTLENSLNTEGVAVDLEDIKDAVFAKRKSVFEAATIQIPTENWMQKGGKEGKHTEHLGFLLAEMQFLQRAYPNSEW